MDYGNETSDSLTEGYVTAEEDSTRYLSVLETSHEMTLESLNLTLGNTGTQLPDQNNGDIVALATESEELNTIDINGQQVVVYNIDGGEELYGLQFVQDEQGNLQKYQFQLRTNDEGQMEAIPETIQLLPLEDESTITQEPDREILNEHSEHNYTEETTDDHVSNSSTETISHAPEELPQNENLQNVDVLEGHLCEESHHTADDVKTGEIEVHYIKEEVLNDEQTMSEEAHKSNKLVQFDDNSVYTIRTDDHLEENTKVVDDFQRSYHNGHPVGTETVTQESVAQYEEVFVRETHNLEDNGDEDQQVVAYIGQNIEEIPHEEHELYYSQNSEDTVYDNIENDSDNDDYHIVEGLHITGDVEEEINPDISNNMTSKPESVLKNACLMNIKDTEKKDLKTVLYYVVRHPEKENMNSLSLPNPVLYKPAKVNPRSLLKSSHIEHKTQQENMQTEKLNKRFSRSKEAMEERLFMNFINRTTIPVEPVRNHRLPRKQKIKPIKRMDDEEIVVQEVVVSSNGFIETLEDGVLKSKEPLKVTETVTLTDSDDDYDPKQAKKKKHRYKKQKQKAEIVISDSTDTEESVIEILSDDEQQLESDKSTSTPKKGRGRPKKIPDEKLSTESDITDNSKSPTKRGRGRPPKLSKINEDEDSESPAKKSRTDDSEDSPPGKNEIKCPKCPKFLASPNSLKTHLQHHNLENSIKNSEASKEVISSTGANKVTSSTEVNEVTSSTNLPDDVNSKTDIVKCTNEDKPTVVKAPIKETTKIPTTRYSVQPRVVTRAKSICNTKADICYKHKCLDCNVTFKNEILLKRHICTKKPTLKLECSVCKKHFPDIAMLNIHKKSHVKNNLVKNTTTAKVSPKVVRTSSMVSTFKSPKKYGIHKCNECGKVCSSVTILNAHMKSHKKFSCNTCKAVFPSRILLDTHIRESCVKTVPPHGRRLSFKVKKSFIQSPKRISSRLPLKRISRKSSVLSTEINTPTTSATTVNRASAKVFQLQCDSCNMKFSSHQTLFDHKVLKHGLNTPDKKNILERSNKKKTLFKQRGTFSGIPASAKLTSAYAALRSKMDNLG